MKINDLFSNIKKDGRALVLGELLIDFVPGETDMRLDQTGTIIKTVSGSAGITAAAIALFGAPCSFIGKLGTDAFSRLSRKVMEELGVNMDFVTSDSTGKLGLAFLEYTENGRNYEYYRDDSVGSRLMPSDITADIFKNAQILHFPGMLLNLNDGMRESCFRAANLAHEQGTLLSFDPNLRKEIAKNPEAMDIIRRMISMSDIIEPTLEEGRIITGKTTVKDVTAALHALGPKLVVLTMDKDGAIFSYEGKILHAEGIHVEIVDPTGAGDAFAAAALYAVHKNMNMEDAIRFCNAAATLVCTKRGAIGMVLPSLAEVEAFIGENDFKVTEYKSEEYKD